MLYAMKLTSSTSLVGSQKVLKAHGCKPLVNNLSIVPHTLGVLIGKKNFTESAAGSTILSTFDRECTPASSFFKMMSLSSMDCRV